MSIRRKAVTVLLATSACVLVLLVVLLNSFVDKNRERIREEIEKSLGRAVKFDDLRLSFWGGIGLLAKHLSIAEDPRFAATPFIQTRELRMELRWLPLFLGNIEIKKFALDEPEVQIIKNEEGIFNLSALAGSERRARETKRESREVKEAKKRHPLSIFPSAIYVSKGKIDYIDRSFKEPVEIGIRNIKLDVQGLVLSRAAKIKISADLFEGQGQNLSVVGRIGPMPGEREWSQYPVDFQVRLDSLLLPQLSRAVPFLRESLSPYLGMTGPLMLEAKFLGTMEQPRITGLTVTGPLFGSAEKNTTLQGELDFSKGHSWREGEVHGKIIVDPASLEYLKRIPFLKQALPSSLTSEGPLSVAGEFQGSFDDLKARLSVKAAETEIRYGNWLNKSKGIPAELDLKVNRRKDRVVFEGSSLTLHNLKLQFSGLLEESPERRLAFQLRSNDVDLAGWEKLLPSLSSYSTGGVVRGEVSVKKILGLQERELNMQGTVTLDQLQVQDRKSGRGVEKMTARLSLRGKEARIEKGQGLWDGISLSNLKGDLAWLPTGLSFKNLSFQALGGTLRANGSWETRPDDSVQLALDSNIEAMDLNALLSQKFPNFKDHIEGQLYFKARLRGESKNSAAWQDSLEGEGATQVRGGSFKNFNLVERVLSKVTGLPGVPNLISSRVPTRYSALFQRKDTPFETLAATFAVKQGRIYSDDLSLVTPDYSVRGEGSIGFDGTTKWDATLAMSAQFTQELLKEHKNARYMVDRQGRLAVPFRLDGTLPYVQARPDLQRLAEGIQKGLLKKGMDRVLGGEKDEKNKTKRDWIQKGLEQLFGK